jgi:hypothetical protein
VVVVVVVGWMISMTRRTPCARCKLTSLFMHTSLSLKATLPLSPYKLP